MRFVVVGRVDAAELSANLLLDLSVSATSLVWYGSERED